MHANAAQIKRWDDNISGVIETSHQRSLSYGLCPGARPDFSPLARNDLNLLIERNRLCTACRAGDGNAVRADRQHPQHGDADRRHGVILHSLGDDDFLERANKVALPPGVDWSEESKGTNAIGTAIAEKAPTLVHADEHYMHANHFLTCSAAPIFDPHGNVSACSTCPATSAASTSTPWRWCACRRG